MSTTTCLPTVLATHAPWPQRLWWSLAASWRELRVRWRRQSARAACAAALRQLPAHTLHDIGMAECVLAEPTLPRIDWEHGRWH